MIEFLYCKRFIYYEMPWNRSNEEKRFKVMMGRKLRKRKSKQEYLPKKIGSCKKMISINLVSEKYGIRGNPDEVHILRTEQWHLWIINMPYITRGFKTYKIN